jgi:APA family basic amino acid/polyamine antiporter
MSINNQLAARLGIFTAVSIVVGSVIGSGIFKKTAVMAQHLDSPVLLLSVWILAGIITLAGAITNAEISSMIPQTGGQYVFFRRIYNNFTGFLYGWAIFAVIQTGSIASISYIFSEYTGYFINLPRLSPDWEAISINLFGFIEIKPFFDIGTKLLTVATIMFLAGINYFGVVLGGFVQNLFTVAKVAAIMVIVFIAFSAGSGSFSHFDHASSVQDFSLLKIVGAMGLALSGAFWAYDGWNNITYISSEIKNPVKNVPKALITGTLIVIFVYVITNIAYIYVLPMDKIIESRLVASDAVKQCIGWAGGAFVAIAVMISTFGTTNGTSLASARVYFAMARDGLFPDKVGSVHEKYKTPHVSLIVQGIWASLLVFTGTFDQLTDMLIFVSWIFYALGAAGVFVLRHKEPDTPRPFKVPLYPFLPAVFILFAVIYVAVSFVGNPRDACFGVLLTCIGIPVYFLKKKK